MKCQRAHLSFLVCLAASVCLAAVPEPVTLEGHGGAVEAVAFSPDGKLLASGGSIRYDEPNSGYARGEVILWDVATREKRQVLSGHPGAVACLAFSPDGKLLASGGRREYWPVDRDEATDLKVWDVASGREMATLVGQGDCIRSPMGTIGEVSC